MDDLTVHRFRRCGKKCRSISGKMNNLPRGELPNRRHVCRAFFR